MRRSELTLCTLDGSGKTPVSGNPESALSQRVVLEPAPDLRRPAADFRRTVVDDVCGGVA